MEGILITGTCHCRVLFCGAYKTRRVHCNLESSKNYLKFSKLIFTHEWVQNQRQSKKTFFNDWLTIMRLQQNHTPDARKVVGTGKNEN